MTTDDSNRSADVGIYPPDEHAQAGARIIRGSALSLLTQVVGNAGIFVAVLMIARALGPASRGAIAFVVVSTLIVSKLATLGVNEALLVLAARRVRARPALITTLLAFVSFTAAALSALVCLLLFAFDWTRPGGVDGTTVVAIGFAAFGFTIQGTFYSFLLGCGRLAAMPLVSAPSWLYALLVIAAELAGRLSVNVAAFSFAIAQLVGAAMLLLVSLRGNGFGRLDRSLMRDAVRFGVRAWAGSVAGYLNFRVDQILMAYLAGAATLGIYAVSVNVSELLLYLPTAAATALAPAIAGSDRTVQVAATLRAMRTIALLTLVTIAVAAAIGPFLIPLVFGSAYDRSVGPFLWLLPGTFGWAAVGLLSRALISASAPGRSSVGLGVALVSGVALDFALIPPFGADGAAAAATAAFLCGGIAAIAAYRTVSPFPLGELVPRAADVAALARLARRALLRLKPDGAVR